MAYSTTNLSAVLLLDSRRFNGQMDQAAERVERFGKKAKQAVDSATAASSRSGMILLEASRGVEDFVAAWSTGGVTGGLRGAANNISQMASLINPMAGGLAGLAVAAGSVALNLAISGKNAEKLEKAVQAGADGAKRFADQVERRLGFENRLKELQSLEGTNAIRGEMAAIDQQIADSRARIDEFRNRIAGRTPRLNELVGLIGGQGQLNRVRGGGVEGFVAGREISTRLAATNQQLGLTGNDRLSFTGVMAEIEQIQKDITDTTTNRLQQEQSINERLKERSELEKRLQSETFRESEIATKEQMTESLDAAAKDAENRRKQFQQLQQTQLDLDIAEVERARAEKRRVPRDQQELNRLQLQKMDQQIELLRETIRTLKDNGITGIGGE